VMMLDVNNGRLHLFSTNQYTLAIPGHHDAVQ
jgi:hypothetical protein